MRILILATIITDLSQIVFAYNGDFGQINCPVVCDGNGTNCHLNCQ